MLGLLGGAGRGGWWVEPGTIGRLGALCCSGLDSHLGSHPTKRSYLALPMTMKMVMRKVLTDDIDHN